MSKRTLLLSVLILLGLALPLFAQEAGHAVTTTPAGNDASAGAGVKWGALAAGFTIAVAAFGGAMGQGRAVAAACDAMGRNPGAAGNIRFITILGLALIESLVIYALIIAFSVR